VEVRATALEVPRDTGSAVPVERTTRLAREDGNVQLRMEAVTLLADHAPDAAWEALESALQDAKPTVREYAERLLEEVEPNLTRPQTSRDRQGYRCSRSTQAGQILVAFVPGVPTIEAALESRLYSCFQLSVGKSSNRNRSSRH
jgi:hypothetical protein